MIKRENIVYLIIGILALIVCWFYNIQHMNEGGDLYAFISNNVLNPASASIFYDISFLFLSISIWMYFESKELKIKYWWGYVIVSLCIGISFSFPIFLIHRNRKLKIR